jgi:hypothetical protein
MLRKLLWTGLYAGLAAGATMAARRAASKIWRVATGEQPPAKLKPSLVKARAQGNAPTNQPPGAPPPSAPTGPQLGSRPKPKKKGRKGGGPSPLVVVGASLVVGIVLAKVVDWRGHAHPRD